MELVLSAYEKAANYLDITLTLTNEGTISFETYRKPNNAYLYLTPNSAHSRHNKIGWIVGELIRLHRTNSTEESFVKHVQVFVQALSKRGYGKKLIEKAYETWLKKNDSIITYPGPSTQLELLPLVGNDGMPTERPPPLVAVLPAATPTAEGMIKIIKEETMQLNIDAPIYMLQRWSFISDNAPMKFNKGIVYILIAVRSKIEVKVLYSVIKQN